MNNEQIDCFRFVIESCNMNIEKVAENSNIKSSHFKNRYYSFVKFQFEIDEMKRIADYFEKVSFRLSLIIGSSVKDYANELEELGIKRTALSKNTGISNMQISRKISGYIEFKDIDHEKINNELIRICSLLKHCASIFRYNPFLANDFISKIGGEEKSWLDLKLEEKEIEDKNLWK